jgi:acetyl esterase/lipase
MNETFLKMAYGLGMLDLIETEPEVPEEILEIKNIEYKNIDSISLQLDLYKRRDLNELAPVLIFIHGGAWRTGKRADYLPYLIDYAKKGYVTATISYRLVKQATFPAAVQDVSCGVKWIKAHAAEYGIDPERIALVGGSAGGHLAMMIGYGGENAIFNQDCPVGDHNVKAIIDLYGPVDLTTPYAISTYQTQDFLNTTYDKNPDIYKLASPKTFISSDDPPTLIFQGAIDSLVPVSQSDSLDIWLEKAGVPHEYHRLKGWPHTMDLAVEVNEYCQFYIDRFLEKYL